MGRQKVLNMYTSVGFENSLIYLSSATRTLVSATARCVGAPGEPLLGGHVCQEARGSRYSRQVCMACGRLRRGTTCSSRERPILCRITRRHRSSRGRGSAVTQYTYKLDLKHSLDHMVKASVVLLQVKLTVKATDVFHGDLCMTPHG